MTDGAPFSARNYTEGDLQRQGNLSLPVDTLNMTLVLAELDKHQLFLSMADKGSLTEEYRNGVDDAVEQYGVRYRDSVSTADGVPLVDAASLFLGTITIINDHPAHDLKGEGTYHHGHLHGLFLCANLLDQMIGIALDNV